MPSITGNYIGAWKDNEALASSYDNHDDEYDSDSECLVHINIKQE